MALLVAAASLAAALFVVHVLRAGAAQSTRGLLTARCQEPSRAGTIDWAARYEPVRLPDGATAIRVLQAGKQRPGGGVSAVAGEWDFSWATPQGSLATVRSPLSAGSPRVVGAGVANLLVPDGKCSLYLSVHAVESPLVGAIGDSVFAGVANQFRSASSDLHLLPAAGWEIRATSGFGWSASAPAWPLSAVRGAWAIGLARGIFSQHPSALVVELGINDALRAAFADVTSHPRTVEAIHAAVSSNVGQLLHEADTARIRCVVLVTAPDHSTSIFGAGTVYAREANRVDQIVEGVAAASPGGNVRIADWATLSQAHHQGPAGWFLPDDVHPNLTGETALVGLVQRSIQSCSPIVTTPAAQQR